MISKDIPKNELRHLQNRTVASNRTELGILNQTPRILYQ